jgi:PAS domain S-box-containing protein
MPDEASALLGVPADEMFELLVESATDFAIFAVDRDGLVATWNAGAERLTGYRADEIVGRSSDLIFTPQDRAAGAPEKERRVAATAGKARDERWHLRKDGSQFWGSGLLMPLSHGAPGFMKVLRDLTEQHQTQEVLRESEARFRILATSIPQLVFRTRPTGERTWGSPQWEVFTGLSDAQSRVYGWLNAVHPDDRELTMAAWDGAVERGSYYAEHRIRRIACNDYRWHQTRATAVDPADPRGGWIGASTDIHDLRALQARQQVLLLELQHRTRNLLALVQALARQTLRSSPTMEAFVFDLEGRLRALSRVQGFVAGSDDELIGLRELVEAEIAAHSRRADGSIDMDGPRVMLEPTAAQSLALALHELATNAAKYGALSGRGGRLSILWRATDDGGRQQVRLDWTESGVDLPPPAEGVRSGYGRELIQNALPYQLGAATQWELRPDGVRCSIVVPLARST